MEEEDGQDEALTAEDQNIEMGDVHIGAKNQKGQNTSFLKNM